MYDLILFFICFYVCIVLTAEELAPATKTPELTNLSCVARGLCINLHCHDIQIASNQRNMYPQKKWTIIALPVLEKLNPR